MRRNKCEFAPPGSKSKNPAPTIELEHQLTTETPMQNLTWLDKMVNISLFGTKLV